MIGFELRENMVRRSRERIRAALARHIQYGDAQAVSKLSGISAPRIQALASGRGRPYADEIDVLKQVLPVTFAQEIAEGAGLHVERVHAPLNVDLHETQENVLEVAAEITRINRRNGGRLCHRVLPALQEKCRRAKRALAAILRREVKQEQAA